MSEGNCTWPNLFIVGAPKSGTTAMHDFLSQHPQVFMSRRKEPHFFAVDMPYSNAVRDEGEYLELFEDAGDVQYRGESSTGYLQSQVAAQRIREVSPDARMVAMLRNPVEVMHAYHSEQLFGANEDIQDFEEALAAETDRRNGLRLPPARDELPRLLYRDVVAYAGQIERYLEVFGRERVHVIVYDDFRQDAAASYRRLCEFLEVDASFTPDIRVVNSSKGVRSERLQMFIQHPPPAIRSMVKAVLPRGLRDRMRSVNAVSKAREPMSPELRDRLAREMAPQIEQLSTLLDRDLTHWCRPQAEPVAELRRAA